MKLTPNWTKGELYSKILLKTPDKQIILTLVPKGTEINFIQTTDKSTFQIIEGKMNFHTNEESINLEIGQFITLRDNIKYNLTSREETVFLLTIVINSLNSIEKINNSNLIYSNNERQDNYY
jgi:quercetin dioxygenase-like cupin family protein